MFRDSENKCLPLHDVHHVTNRHSWHTLVLYWTCTSIVWGSLVHSSTPASSWQTPLVIITAGGTQSWTAICNVCTSHLLLLSVMNSGFWISDLVTCLTVNPGIDPVSSWARVWLSPCLTPFTKIQSVSVTVPCHCNTFSPVSVFLLTVLCVQVFLYLPESLDYRPDENHP